MRGLVINAPTSGARGAGAAIAAPAPVLTPAAPAVLLAGPSSAVTLDWRAVFGASAVRAILAAWPAARLTSFIRSPATNARVGGRPGSYHLVGLAADFVLPAADRGRFLAWVRATWPAGMDVVDEGDHIHIEWEDVTATPLARNLGLAGLALVLAVLFIR